MSVNNLKNFFFSHKEHFYFLVIPRISAILSPENSLEVKDIVTQESHGWAFRAFQFIGVIVFALIICKSTASIIQQTSGSCSTINIDQTLISDANVLTIMPTITTTKQTIAAESAVNINLSSMDNDLLNSLPDAKTLEVYKKFQTLDFDDILFIKRMASKFLLNDALIPYRKVPITEPTVQQLSSDMPIDSFLEFQNTLVSASPAKWEGVVFIITYFS